MDSAIAFGGALAKTSIVCCQRPEALA